MSQAHQYLEETDRLLAESKARVERQKQRVANLEAATLNSKALLRELEETLLLINSHREALVQEIAKDTASPEPPPLRARSVP
jgi:hypothetical protein